jgi:tetratricopeptide (TPR) repeat protein
LTLETDPEGATVIDNNGQQRGRTPLTLPDLPEGAWRFTVEREGYEPLTAEVWINSNQSNYFQTNLVSHQYAAALRLARDYLAAGQYEEAVRSAGEALRHKAGDTAATSLKREATGRNHLARAKTFAESADYTSAIQELKSASAFFPENAQIKDLVASYAEKQKDVLEREAQKKAKERAAEQRQAGINGLKMTLAIECRRYSGFEAFAVHELSTTNDVREVAKVLPRAMTIESPIFEMARYEWQHDDFVMDYRQKVLDGSRQCVIVGGQMSTNECVICFRVIEGQTPHGFSWAGGLISAQLTTDADRNGERAARFQQQVKEGEQMVEERIRRTLGQSSTKL